MNLQMRQAMSTNLLPIAKEGWNYIFSAVLAFVIFNFLDLSFLEFFSFLAVLFLIFVFRNPERENKIFEESSVCSPVDGVVSSIEEIDDGEYGYKIDIESNYFNVSLLRVPLTSSITSSELHRGSRVSSVSNLSKLLNENAKITFTDKNSNSVKVIHRLNKSFKSIDIDAKEGQNLYKGSRYGLMLNGTTTMLLPKNFRFNVSVGNDLIASENLIGYFTN